MTKINETLARQWAMLRMLPRYPYKITASQIVSRLSSEGFVSSKRTIERDLHELSRTFPLTLDARAKPFGWSWQKDAPAFDLPGLGEHEALMLLAAEKYLKNLLPQSTIDVLKPYFGAAAKKLNAAKAVDGSANWMDKVDAVQPGQQLHSPVVDPETQRVVTDGLLYGRQLKIQYRKRGSDQSIAYKIHPLGLVQRGVVLYLCVRIGEYEDVRLLAMHRIIAAEVLDEQAVFPSDFKLRDHIADGLLDFGNGEKVELVLVFTESAGQHLFETPLSIDQTISSTIDNRLKVIASVPDTPQLYWWLMGFGDGVEVLAPAHIRSKMIETVNNLKTLYGISDVQNTSK